MPRGQNLKRGPERDAHTALIRERWRASQQPAAPEPEGTAEVGPSKAERLRGSHAFQALRAAYWARPVISPQGKLVAAVLPESHVLPWEVMADVVASEAPTYSQWRIVGTSFGPALVEPGKLPSLIDPEEVPDGAEFVPVLPANGEFVVVVEPETSAAVPTAPEVEIEVVDGVALVTLSSGAD